MALPMPSTFFGISTGVIAIITDSYAMTESTQTFRLVVIEADLLSKSSNVDFLDYESVLDAFDLE